MKKIITLLSLLIFFFWIFQGCKKMDPGVENNPDQIDNLTISPSFDWETTRDIDFLISNNQAVVISVTSGDGATLFHQGFYYLVTDIYRVRIKLPSYIQQVLVNGLQVEITGNVIPVSLSQKNIPGLKDHSESFLKGIPMTGLLAAWHFDENGGTIAHDSEGLHDGTISGATWVPGINGSALDFDGTGGHVQIPNNTQFNPVSDQISFSLWFKMNQVGDEGGFIFQNVKYLIRIDNQGKITFALYTPVWYAVVMDWSTRILDTDWHHVAATYDGAIMKLYLDGNLMESGNNTGTLQSSTSDVYIGNQNTIKPFPGIIDEVLMYNYALTETEINQIFTNTPDPGTGSGSLISSWNLNENAGTTAIDGTDGNNGVIEGATWSSGISGSGLTFNGISDNVRILNAQNLNPTDGLTMMVWAKTQENKTAKIFQKGDWDGHGIGQGKWDGWFANIRLSDNTSRSLHWEGGLPILNEWYHLAMTYDGSTLKFYVNGQLKNSVSVSGSLKVNTRDMSFGSDNGAQKFFNGSIDELQFFGTALTQTEIQANYNEPGNSPDGDGDGIPDAEDVYPSDPARAFDNYYPAPGFGSLAFEDLWPGTGDYDFNDLVLDYRFKIVTSGSNNVTEILGSFVVRAIGAGLQNGFGFQLPGTTIQNNTITVSGYNLQDNYIILNENGTEANQEITTIIVFDNAFNMLPSAGGFGVNVDPGSPYVEPDTLVITMGFTPGLYSIEDIGLINFNPFLIVNEERGKEIHLPDYPPTSLVNPDYFHTAQDDSDPATGKYYKTATNLPWAINIAEKYDYTIEHQQITNGYLNFAPWAESSGTIYPDWYKDIPGYRNDQNIYQKR